MLRMDIIKKLKDQGYVLLGADIEEIKQELPYLDLKKSLSDPTYMDFMKESLLTQDEAWGHFRYDYAESKVVGVIDGHIWIKARIKETPDVLEEYKKLSGIDNNSKYSELFDGDAPNKRG